MARQDLRKQITIFPPDGKPGEKHSLLNARDLITHKGWTTTPQSEEQFRAVADLLKEAKIEPTEEELIRQALLEKPIDKMTLAEVHEFAEIEFGTKIDKRLNLNKAVDRLQEIADASNYKLKFSDDKPEDEDDQSEDEDEKKDDAKEDDSKDDDQNGEDEKKED